MVDWKVCHWHLHKLHLHARKHLPVRVVTVLHMVIRSTELTIWSTVNLNFGTTLPLDKKSSLSAPKYADDKELESSDFVNFCCLL